MKAHKQPTLQLGAAPGAVAALMIAACLAGGATSVASADSKGYEIRVLGSVDEAIAYWKERDFWGEEKRGKTLAVPRAITVAIDLSWKQEAERVTVDVKKELFYRAAAPLILYANELILQDREQLQSLARRQGEGKTLNADEIQWLGNLADHYRLLDPEKGAASEADILATIDELMVRVDIIPPALALGQAAYESGYGTSRFALTGNAFFGQWTWGGKGMKPLQQRKSKGDYRVATYDWPFDSVRAYMLNLNTQRAYADLRRVRAELSGRGEKLTGLALAETLTKYSERGQAYVKTLKGIIKTNGLDIADNARLRDERTVLLVEAEHPRDKVVAEKAIEGLRASGELENIIKSMRLNQTR